MNSEYKYWLNFFQNNNFKNNLQNISDRLKGKKVLLYCCGAYFDALADSFNFTEMFDIKGVADLKFSKETTDNYKGFKAYKPSDVKNTNADCVIITSPNADNISKILRNDNIILPNTAIISLNIDSDDDKWLRDNYKKKIRELKTKDKIRVVFILEENTKWSYQLLYEKLKSDGRFEVLPVALLPIITKNRVEYTQKMNSEFLKKLNVEAIDYYDYENKQNKDIKDLKPDIVFYSQPWYLMNVNHPKIVSNYALTCLVPYGYTTLGGENWGSNNVKEVYRSVWKFFSESDYHNTFYEQFCNMKENLCTTGSLKFDYYKTPVKPEFEELWKGDNQKARIIYAPHHSLGNNGLKMSTFDRDYLYFLNLAKNNPQYSFILKPHPALKSMCVFEKLMTEKEYDDYINEWNNLENAVCYDKGNYFDIFKSSDCLITDCSSFLGEYYPTRKPIMYLNRPDRAPFDDFGAKIRKGFYEFNDTTGLETLLYDVLINNNDTMFQTREKILQDEFYLPDEPAYEKILKCITIR